MAVDGAGLRLDAEDDPAGVDQLLDLGSPAVIDVAAGVFADVVVFDVAVHQNARLDADLGGLGGTQGVTDHFLGISHRRLSSWWDGCRKLTMQNNTLFLVYCQVYGDAESRPAFSNSLRS